MCASQVSIFLTIRQRPAKRLPEDTIAFCDAFSGRKKLVDYPIRSDGGGTETTFEEALTMARDFRSRHYENLCGAALKILDTQVCPHLTSDDQGLLWHREEIMKIGKMALMAASALTAGLLSMPAMAQTNVTWMYVESNPNTIAIWEEMVAEYEAANPGVTIQMEFLENEAFKAKLPTLLQSDEAPDIFYSWGGGVLDIQRKSGALRPITAELDANGGEWRNSYAAGAVAGLTFDGDVWAVPFRVGTVAFFYNKEQFAQAGVDADSIATWDDLLAAISSLKAAGLTPLTCGGADKWPLHFYYSYLLLRIGGEEAMAAAKANEPDAFMSDAFIKTGEKMIELGAMEPCQNGYLGSRWPEPLGDFADGRAAMILAFDNTGINQVAQATDGKGQPLDNIGRFAFPTVEGGAGDANITFGGLNGWALSKNAPDEAVDFMRWFTSVDQQRKLATSIGIIPVALGAEDGVVDSLMRMSAEALGNSPYHQNYLDQDLGPNLGRTVNDVSVELWSGQMTAEEAAQMVQETADLGS
jgi:raffinose/stachyose/melibiose transport system substrate-binding protein